MNGRTDPSKSILVASAFFSVTALAQPGQRTGLSSVPTALSQIPHTSAPIEINGVLDEDAWQDALVIELTIETGPGENIAAPVKTFAHIIEDGSTLYVGFDAHDPNPEEIRAYLRDRDSAWNDDLVGVVLDTFGDERRAFEFFVNPLGVQMDLTMDDVNRREDDSWDAIWDSAGSITENGFLVEMAIPFTQLRFPRSDGLKTWGIDALRFYPRENGIRMSNNSLVRGRNCYLCQLEKVQGLENAEPGRDLEIVPALTASRTDTRENLTSGPWIAGSSMEDVGLTVRWGITPDMTANIAINPDFSQVEADAPQLDVNNQFALFFPETRPFFLEGADFFQTPIQRAVFTRTIADPDFGAKLTGRNGTDTYGVFLAKDTVTNLLFPGALGSRNESLDRSSNTLVGRYTWGFGQSSSIGTLVTSRDSDNYSNRMGGFDGRYRLTDRQTLSFQYLHSETEYPGPIVSSFDQPDGRFGGDALLTEYRFNSRDWFANINYRSFDSMFRADMGFISQVDVVQRNLQGGHVWHGDQDNWWTRLQIGANYARSDDQSGRILGRQLQTFFVFQGPLQSYLQTGTVKRQQFWNGVVYDMRGVFLSGQVRPRRGLNLTLSLNKGGQIDLSNSRIGDQLRLSPSIEWNASRHVLIRLSQNLTTLDAKEGPNIFDAAVTDMRLTWQFNVRSFFRLSVQQQLVERNLAMFNNPSVDARSRTMGTQVLYSYKLNPQTVFFAGYSDNHLDNDDLVDLTRTDRTFFIKLSYAWSP